MKKSLVFSFSLLGQVGFAVAIPLLALGLTGRYLDKRFETGPYLFLAGIALSLPVAYLAVKRIATKAIKEFEN